MPQRLKVEEILTVGFVDRGDDPEAEIVFFKRKPDEAPAPKEGGVKALIAKIAEKLGIEKNEVEELLADGAEGGSSNDGGPNSNGESDMTFDVSKLDDEARAAFDAAVEAAVNERLAAEDEGGDDLPPDLPESVTKVLGDFQKQLDAANARADKAEEKHNALVEKQERQRYIAKAASFQLPGAEPDDFAEILRKAESALTTDEVEKLDSILKAASAAVEASLGETGRGGVGSTSVDAEVETLAKAYREQDPSLTMEMAQGKVWQSRPDLYRKYREERAANLNHVGD